jgi:hypothetical protein
MMKAVEQVLVVDRAKFVGLVLELVSSLVMRQKQPMPKQREMAAVTVQPIEKLLPSHWEIQMYLLVAVEYVEGIRGAAEFEH